MPYLVPILAKVPSNYSCPHVHQLRMYIDNCEDHIYIIMGTDDHAIRRRIAYYYIGKCEDYIYI